MSIRILSISLLAVTISGAAVAATPGDAPAEKPVLNHAPLNMNDQLLGTTIRGQAPIGPNVISIDHQDIEANKSAPDPLDGMMPHRVQVPVSDPPGFVIRGKPPVGTVRDPRLDPKFKPAKEAPASKP